MTVVVIGDTCSLVNFAVVRRADLLEALYGDSLRCTEAVVHELVRLSATLPEVCTLLGTRWLDDPVVLDDPVDVAAVERLRRTVLGGRSRRPLQHLGEAQSLHAVSSLPSLVGAVLLTDDGATLDYAARKQITAIDTADVLGAAYDRGLVGCPEAYDLLLAMRAHDRWVRVPAHAAVCP